MNRKLNDTSDIFIIIILVFCQLCCNNDERKTEKVSDIKSRIGTDLIKNKFLTLVGDSVKIILKDQIVIINKKSVFNYQNTYEGIYEIKSDSIIRHFSLKLNNILYFTTYEDAGRGYIGFLHAYNLKNKRVIKNNSSDYHDMISTAGKFIFKKGAIFAIEKPYYYEHKKTFLTPAAIFQISGNKFKYIKTIYAEGEKAYGDTSIIDFYNNNIKIKQRRPLKVPKDWFAE